MLSAHLPSRVVGRMQAFCLLFRQSLSVAVPDIPVSVWVSPRSTASVVAIRMTATAGCLTRHSSQAPISNRSKPPLRPPRQPARKSSVSRNWRIRSCQRKKPWPALGNTSS